MPETEKLNSDQIEIAIQSHPAWTLNSKNQLQRDFVFKTFPEAFSFMTRVALEAEQLDHHPDWSNSYNKVTIALSTHAVGGITEKDLELIRRIEKFNWS
jgi:4a-hydroxytetrahydrobiopterin dehydratase